MRPAEAAPFERLTNSLVMLIMALRMMVKYDRKAISIPGWAAPEFTRKAPTMMTTARPVLRNRFITGFVMPIIIPAF